MRNLEEFLMTGVVIPEASIALKGVIETLSLEILRDTEESGVSGSVYIYVPF